jgi:hypothetical protein
MTFLKLNGHPQYDQDNLSTRKTTTKSAEWPKQEEIPQICTISQTSQEQEELHTAQSRQGT